MVRFSAVLLSLALPTFAFAQGATTARDAYDRGAAAFAQKDYAVAASEFARADELNPHPAALLAALKAAVLANDPLLAMQLADRADSRPRDEGTARAAEAARAKFSTRVGKLVPRCHAASS